MDLYNTTKTVFPSCFVLFLIIPTILSGALGSLLFWQVLRTHLRFSENYPLWLPDLFPWMAAIKLELTFCVFTSCYFTFVYYSAFLNTEFQPTQSFSNMKPFPKFATSFVFCNPHSFALFANFLLEFSYSCTIQLRIMPKRRLKSKLPYRTHRLRSPAWSPAVTCKISVAEAAKKVQYISVWTLVHTDGMVGVQEELNVLQTAALSLLCCSLAKSPGATEAATRMENTQVRGWGCKCLHLNLVLSCMSHMWKDQSGKKKKKHLEKEKTCQHQVNGVCDVPT